MNVVPANVGSRVVAHKPSDRATSLSPPSMAFTKVSDSSLATTYASASGPSPLMCWTNATLHPATNNAMVNTTTMNALHRPRSVAIVWRYSRVAFRCT